MRSSTFRIMCIPLMLVVLALNATGVWADDDELTEAASWAVPSAESVLGELLKQLESQQTDASVRKQVEQAWKKAASVDAPPRPLELLAESLALVDPRYRKVVEFSRSDPQPAIPRKFSILEDARQAVWIRNQLRLLYGRWLAQHALYDEALEQLGSLTVDQVADPAALLFYQSVAHHRLLHKEDCIPLVTQLLENEPEIPVRYATVAQLIQADIQPLKVDSLDEISRMMDEIERRLGHARAGQRVRSQEDEVLEKLDKMIKKMEEQQQQASSSSSLQPSNPAQDSRPMSGKGPGNVDPKHLGNRSGWGNLPPKQRQEALQQIGKELPAHYREVIEEYFRKLAREGGG